MCKPHNKDQSEHRGRHMYPNRTSNAAATLQTNDKDNQYNTEEIWVFKNNEHCGDQSKNNS